MEGGTEINCARIGTYRALEWQQLNRITVGLCLCWHKVTLRARNPNCEITGRSRYGKGLRELEREGGGELRIKSYRTRAGRFDTSLGLVACHKQKLDCCGQSG